MFVIEREINYKKVNWEVCYRESELYIQMHNSHVYFYFFNNKDNIKGGEKVLHVGKYHINIKLYYYVSKNM